MSPARPALAALAVLLGAALADAQPKDEPRVKEPKRPDKLDIQIRYRIRAAREERVKQFLALERFLAGLGFVDRRKDDPDRDLDALDPTHERLVGTIPSEKVLDVLNDPRVLNILFAPAGYPYPDSPDKPVPIRVVIRDGLIPVQQQVLHGQVLA